MQLVNLRQIVSYKHQLSIISKYTRTYLPRFTPNLIFINIYQPFKIHFCFTPQLDVGVKKSIRPITVALTGSTTSCSYKSQYHNRKTETRNCSGAPSKSRMTIRNQHRKKCYTTKPYQKAVRVKPTIQVSKTHYFMVKRKIHTQGKAAYYWLCEYVTCLRTFISIQLTTIAKTVMI